MFDCPTCCLVDLNLGYPKEFNQFPKQKNHSQMVDSLGFVFVTYIYIFMYTYIYIFTLYNIETTQKFLGVHFFRSLSKVMSIFCKAGTVLFKQGDPPGSCYDSCPWSLCFFVSLERVAKFLSGKGIHSSKLIWQWKISSSNRAYICKRFTFHLPC